MDLDDFKSINDSHGHHVGDRALCEVARVLRTAIRPYDICVRYAGDEFIVVLSGCDADEAQSKRAELQQNIDDVYFEARPGKQVPLGISVGAACFRRTASRTRRSSPRQIAGCIKTSPAASGPAGAIRRDPIRERPSFPSSASWIFRKRRRGFFESLIPNH